MAHPATSDVIVIGGGVGGLSAAAALAPYLKVLVLEAEEYTGSHSSGRSATMFHYALGNPLIRALTKASRTLFDHPPAHFTARPAHSVPILVFARTSELDALHEARDAMAPFTSIDWVEGTALHALCPLLRREGPEASVAGLLDRTALRIDQHALMQGYIQQLRAHGGRVATERRVSAIARALGGWSITCASGERYAAPLIVNAAGAWGDAVARLAGVAPLGLVPLRRTIITFDAPSEVDPARLPFCKTVGEELYFSGESGQLFASPMDESESMPCDSQPDDVDIATAAWRMEQRTSVKIDKINAKWSGLRTFAPDRSPVIGFSPEEEGFLWCVGQGGSGLQTSPACAAIVASLVAGTPWPIAGYEKAKLGPARLRGRET